jgi:phosphotransferase system HPr-like phosphotransfer protein
MDVKTFVERISPLEGQFDLVDGMYVVDAKSLMGILVMDLTKPIQLRIEKCSDSVMQAIESFLVDEPTSAQPGS